LPLPHHSRFCEALLLLGVASPFCRHQHNFPKGRQYLDSHFPFNERSRMAQGETPLLPDVIDPHNIRRQHFLMLRWVLLCDYCSFSYQLLKTSELGRATNAHITVVVYFHDHYHWFRVCSFAELSFAFIIPPPRALQLSTPTLQTFFFSSELHHTSMGHARLICTHLYIDTQLMEGRVLLVPFFSKGVLYMVPLLLSLTTPFSVKETLMDFGHTFCS
jgi:hypothetical protein